MGTNAPNFHHKNSDHAMSARVPVCETLTVSGLACTIWRCARQDFPGRLSGPAKMLRGEWGLSPSVPQRCAHTHTHPTQRCTLSLQDTDNNMLLLLRQRACQCAPLHVHLCGSPNANSFQVTPAPCRENPSDREFLVRTFEDFL